MAVDAAHALDEDRLRSRLRAARAAATAESAGAVVAATRRVCGSSPRARISSVKLVSAVRSRSSGGVVTNVPRPGRRSIRRSRRSSSSARRTVIRLQPKLVGELALDGQSIAGRPAAGVELRREFEIELVVKGDGAALKHAVGDALTVCVARRGLDSPRQLVHILIMMMTSDRVKGVMSASGGAVLAIDLGATWTRAAVVSRAGEVAARSAAHTPADGAPERLAEAVLVVAGQALAAAGAGGDGVVAVGVASVGPLDARAGVLVAPPNLGGGYRGLDLATPLRRRFDVPVFVRARHQRRRPR